MLKEVDQTKEPWLRYWLNRSYKIPVAGYLLRMATAVWNLPVIINNLKGYQASTDARLAGKADRDSLDELRRILEGTPAGESAAEARLLGAMYMSFEDRFRGPREEIKRRQGVYLPAIAGVAPVNGTFSLLDLGCGRGEWLELLKEKGCLAKGVDVNGVAVRQCRERGLDVVEADCLEYLRGIARNSLDAVTGFHLIEHLPFKAVVALFDEALAALKSGGMIILETPNPTNILVSAYDFYRDPGHLRPLHPDTVDFLAENRGFVRTGAYFVVDEGRDLTLIKSTDWPLNDITDYIRAPRDFALIAYKP